MGWLGVSAQPVTPDIAEALGLQEPVGAIINGITKGSPAEKAGLRHGDVIVALDGKKILDPSELPRMVAFRHISKTVLLTVIREGKPLDIKAVVEMKPDK